MKGEGLAAGIEQTSLQEVNFLLPFWHHLIGGTATFLDFIEAVRGKRQLTYLTIDTTGACDLKCTGMCYYNPEISLGRGLIPESFLRQAIAQAASELSLRVLTFAGKEPFLNAARLFSLAKFAGALPDRNFSIGTVTNGRHIARHKASLAEIVGSRSLDYIDVSIDSADPNQHDALRGIDGTHQLAVDAVLWLNREFPELRITVPSVLRQQNASGILRLISYLAPHNHHFQIQPIQPPPASPFMPLTPDEILRFLDDLTALLNGPLHNAGIEVSIELLGIYVLEAVQKGILTWSEIQEDSNNVLFVEKAIGGNTLLITCEIFPLQAWRLARIMYDGAYLAHMHFLQSKTPEALAVGSLEEKSIVALFDLATAPQSHFSQVIASRINHDCHDKPCWNNCFGCWNGAENAFIENHGNLTSQPRLCRKDAADFEKLLPVL